MNLPTTISEAYLPAMSSPDFPQELIGHHAQFSCRCGQTIDGVLSGFVKNQLVVYYRCLTCGYSLSATSNQSFSHPDGLDAQRRIARNEQFHRLFHDLIRAISHTPTEERKLLGE